jgi:hypothetical protein
MKPKVHPPEEEDRCANCEECQCGKKGGATAVALEGSELAARNSKSASDNEKDIEP